MGNVDRKICQVGVLTKDAESAIKKCVELLEIGPWTLMTMSNANVIDSIMYDKAAPDSFCYYCATAMIGNFQIEYMQPIEGVLAYEESIKKHGHCMQHFKEAFTNEQIEEITKACQSRGLVVSYSGHFVNDIFVNIDTEEKLDCLVELGNFADVDITCLPRDQYRFVPEEEKEQAVLAEINRERKIRRMTVITNRLLEVMANASKMMGYGPWHISEVSTRSGGVFQRAYTQIGDMEMEFIQPVQGVELFDHFCQKHGFGILGISEELSNEDMDACIHRMAEKGIRITVDYAGGGKRTVIFDTLDILGFAYGIVSVI